MTPSNNDKLGELVEENGYRCILEHLASRMKADAGNKTTLDSDDLRNASHYSRHAAAQLKPEMGLVERVPGTAARGGAGR